MKTHKLQQKSLSRYKLLTKCFPMSRNEHGTTHIENRSSAEQMVTMLLKIRRLSAPLLRIS